MNGPGDPEVAIRAVPVEKVMTVVDAQSAVEFARSGSLPAFEQIYRDHVGRVYAICLRLCGDAARAEELTQDVFVRAWEKLDTFRGDSALSTWLHRLAVNVVLGARRSEGRREKRVVGVEDPSVFDTTGSAPAAVGERLDLEAALRTLPEASRTVFVLHDVEGYTHDEIARLTGRAEGTSKTLLHRARKALRERLR